MTFPDRLAEAVQTKGTPLCVGLDPRWESLPKAVRARFGTGSLESVAAAYESFSLKVLDLVADRVGVIKPQSAFFEACGPTGLAALQKVIRRGKELGLVVVLDSKRGDIASTAQAYADAAFAGTAFASRRQPVWDADAVTVNPYLGEDSVAPFIATARASGRGVFVLVRTSNPGAGRFQDLEASGRRVYEHVARAVAEWNEAGVGTCGLGDVGAVVGATRPAELGHLRTVMQSVWLLVPGYGAQGGTATDLANVFRPDGLGAIVNSSRGITFPFHPDDPDWERAIRSATERAAAELGAVSQLSR
jgi:orotidine-5'-phosphate decarboxylase